MFQELKKNLKQNAQIDLKLVSALNDGPKEQDKSNVL